MKNKLRLIFVGRLEQEKGFHLILDMCKHLSTQEGNSITLDVFGDGSLKNSLISLLDEYPFITYHGHQPKEYIKDIWKKSHYTLMPSLFLETFGLTALDSLSLGVPIIAPSKGGLAQFTKDEYVIENAKNLLDIIQYLIATFDESTREVESKEAFDVSRRYSEQIWLDRFIELSGLEPGARILLVSDFIIDIGGIEHYLLAISGLLQQAGYEVRLIGCDDEYVARNRFSQLRKTIRNSEGDRLFSKTIDEFVPDLVRRHSIQRRWGPLVLRRARHVRSKHWIMYHDFGLFHPYPSRVYTTQQVATTNSFFSYMHQGCKVRCSHIIFHVAKRCSRVLLMSHLVSMVDMHVVPSPFMEDLVQAHYTKPITITTLSHF